MQDGKNSPALWRKIYADSKFMLIYAIVCKKPEENLQKRTLWDITSAKMTLEETKRNF